MRYSVDGLADRFWDREGSYDPYGGIILPNGTTNLYTNINDFSGGGSSAGNALIDKGFVSNYVPPTKPDLTYVPSANSTDGTIRLNLKSAYNSSYTENGENIGFAKDYNKSYTFFTFGPLKTFKAESDSRTLLNYYTVEIISKYAEAVGLTKAETIGRRSSSVIDRYLDKIDITSDAIVNRYAEILSVKEYVLNDSGKYEFYNERTYNLEFTNASGTVFGSNNIIADLEFRFKDKEIKKPLEELPIEIPKENKKYSVLFNSNYKSELGDLLTLSYDLLLANTDILSGYYVSRDSIKLSIGNSEEQELDLSVFKELKFSFRIDGTISALYKVKSVYYTVNRANVDRNLPFDRIDFSKWNKASTLFEINAAEVTGDIYVYIVFDKEPEKIIPILNIDNRVIEVEVSDSDRDKQVTIPFKTIDTTHVDAHFENGKIVRVNARDSKLILKFNSDFNREYGVKKVKLLPVNTSQNNAQGNWVTVLINFLSVDNFPSIIQTTAPALIDIPSFSDSNIEFEVMYKSLNATSVDIDLVGKNNKRLSFQKNAPVNNSIKININELGKKYSDWNGSDNVTLIVKPYNRGGEKELIGNEYEIITNIVYPKIRLDEQIIKKVVYDAFSSHLKLSGPEKDSKYLTHLLNLGNDSRILISTFDEDNWTLSEKVEDDIGNISIKSGGELKSLLIKLYSPLPPEIEVNDTFWITKLVTNPLIETVILNEQSDRDKKYLRGPNFDIDIDFVKGTSTNYESLDDLILSSNSSNKLFQSVLGASSISAEDLNIEYVKGSISEETAEYQWQNFVHFSSAEERIKNFVYKLQLIENYENLIISASTDYKGNGNALWTGSFSTKKEIERQQEKKSKLIEGFDGFEMFLFTSSSQYTTATSSSMTWPFNNGVRLKTTNAQSIGWYNNIVEVAAAHDINNANYLINNIPQFITTKPENENFLLFFSMVGHHFDILYFYTKAIENSRLKGYKNKNGMSDALLFDYLKSFGWNAQQLGSGAELWDYLYGENIEGVKTNKTNLKERNNEVWRRVVNNLPYLLKHKGTRRGIYALMACYGIPASNLSIMEFGGPEVSDETISRLLIDDKSYALKFDTSTTIVADWNTTNKNRKPDTIEMFVKPASNQIPLASFYNSSTLFNIGGQDNPSTKVSLEYYTSSIDNRYGKIVFADTNNNIISSSFLPLFNDRFFGVSVSRTLSGSYQTVQLNVMQTEGDREIFNYSITGSYTTASSRWNNATNIYFGNIPDVPRFSGSIDEIRLWSTPLDKARFEEHVYYPEAINGNHISSSTEDLHLRIDFEYPKPYDQFATNYMPNVAPILKYSGSHTRNDYEDGLVSYNTIEKLNPSASVSVEWSVGNVVTTYPYNFEVIQRDSVLEIPSLGASRYSTNKVRFISQSLVSDLSFDKRATKKSSEYAPIDSNRVGVFVSPMKELNLDIAKSLGSNRLDDYVGDPSDLYNDTYKELNNLRRYYFQRVKNPDMYEYVNIIKSYERAMFDDIKQMLPARTKATTGLLIEPHFLERNKHKYKKPIGDWYDQEKTIDVEKEIQTTGENNQYNTDINTDISTLEGENNQYDSILNMDIITPVGENNQYDSLLDVERNVLLGGSFNYFETNIDAKNEMPSVETLSINTEANYDTFEDVSFSAFILNDGSGSAIRTYYDDYGNRIKERVRVYEIYEEYKEKLFRYNIAIDVTSPVSGLQSTYGDSRAGFTPFIDTKTRKKIIVLPFTGSNGLPSPTPTTGSQNIVSVRALRAYSKNHYRNVGDLTTGLQNSYYKGSKNTRFTTIDGSSPIEVFISNPNAIKVLPGKSSTEPIIGTDI